MGVMNFFRNNRSDQKREDKIQKTGRTSRLEQMEDRIMLSAAPWAPDLGAIAAGPSVCNVEVSLNSDSGTLKIVGSSCDDSVSIESGRMGPDVTANGETTHFTPLQKGMIDLISFTGSEGDDHFENSTGKDTWAFGGDGDDTIQTSWGDDLVHSGDGDDVIKSGAGNDIVTGAEGADTINSGSGNDFVYGHDGDDSIEAGNGDDNIQGGDGADRIKAGSGDDVVDGGAGNDTLEGGAGNDSLDGGAGTDTASYGSASTTTSFNITPGAKATLAFTQEPSHTQYGVDIAGGAVWAHRTGALPVGVSVARNGLLVDFDAQTRPIAQFEMAVFG